MYQIYFAQMSVCVNSSDIELANKINELSVIPISYLDLVIDNSVIGSIRYDLIIRSHINYPVPLPRKLYPYPVIDWLQSCVGLIRLGRTAFFRIRNGS